MSTMARQVPSRFRCCLPGMVLGLVAAAAGCGPERSSVSGPPVDRPQPPVQEQYQPCAKGGQSIVGYQALTMTTAGLRERCAAPVSGKIHLSGGRRGNQTPLDLVEIIDPATGLVTAGMNLPTPSNGHGCVGLPEKAPTQVLVFGLPGGRNGQSRTFRAPLTGAGWVELVDTFQYRHFSQGVAIGREVWALGANYAQSYDPGIEDKWPLRGKHTHEKKGGGSLYWPPLLCLSGGESEMSGFAGTLFNVTECANMLSGDITWSVRPELILPRPSGSVLAATYGGRAYLLIETELFERQMSDTQWHSRGVIPGGVAGDKESHPAFASSDYGPLVIAENGQASNFCPAP